MSLETMKEIPLLVVVVDMNSYIAKHLEPMQELSNMISFSQQVQDHFIKKLGNYFGPRKAWYGIKPYFGV